MQNNKSAGNDGLTKKNYEGFWDEIKELFLASGTEAKNKDELKVHFHVMSYETIFSN